MLKCFAIKKHLWRVFYAKKAYASPRLDWLTYLLHFTLACIVFAKFLGRKRIFSCPSRRGLFYVANPELTRGN